MASHFERWFSERPASSRPVFAFLNFLEAHYPYHQVPEPYLHHYTERSSRELREVSLLLDVQQQGAPGVERELPRQLVTDLYDGGVRYTDHLLGRVVEALRRRGSLDRTLLVVVSDHGELLGEHGSYGHGRSLFEPAVRVPLLLRYPPRIGRGVRVDQPVSSVGLMATILELVGVEARAPLQVGSLLPTLEGRTAGGPVVVERFAAPGPSPASAASLLRGDLRHRSYRAGTLKLVETSAGGRSLFDLADDPQEGHDLAGERPLELARLVAELRDLAGGDRAPGSRRANRQARLRTQARP